MWEGTLDISAIKLENLIGQTSLRTTALVFPLAYLQAIFHSLEENFADTDSIGC